MVSMSFSPYHKSRLDSTSLPAPDLRGRSEAAGGKGLNIQESSSIRGFFRNLVDLLAVNFLGPFVFSGTPCNRPGGWSKK
jgi:hypothetical protein